MQTLFDQPKATSDFERYDREHPNIWERFKEITFDLIRRGKRHYGAKAIFEIIRYESSIEYSQKHFKVNNKYTAYYSRKFMMLYPEHKGFFRTKQIGKGKDYGH